MEPLWKLVETAIISAQDDQGQFYDDEEKELRKLVEWLKRNDVRTTSHLD